ncbi:unnamed protein product [Hermetia illucens]|uniref:Uncharacterized protein n=1 Tax=Hermetia illucens TaxID=343691 RepID=A0A7R8UAM7_HERIL|nr:unnamed protein product [Hermetia illucens]
MANKFPPQEDEEYAQLVLATHEQIKAIIDRMQALKWECLMSIDDLRQEADAAERATQLEDENVRAEMMSEAIAKQNQRSFETMNYVGDICAQLELVEGQAESVTIKVPYMQISPEVGKPAEVKAGEQNY